MPYKIDHLITIVAENDDQLAFNDLYRHYYPGLLSFANGILKNRQNAEEVILDVFLKLWENRKMLLTIKNLSNYLYVAVRHSCISSLRKQKVMYSQDYEDDFQYTYHSPELHLISKENLLIINSAIQSLPERCRLIFRLVKEERLKYDEVAKLLNLSIKTVEAQLSIANKKLAATLLPLLPEYQENIAARK